MTNEELQKKLDLLKDRLSKANKDNDIELVNLCVDELNSLWDKASVDMLKNSESDNNITI